MEWATVCLLHALCKQIHSVKVIYSWLWDSTRVHAIRSDHQIRLQAWKDRSTMSTIREVTLCLNTFPPFQDRSVHVRTFSPNPQEDSGPPNIGGELDSGGEKKCTDTKSVVLVQNVRTGATSRQKVKICTDGTQFEKIKNKKSTLV